MAVSLEESARRAGANRWLEARLFEVIGAWVAATPETAARLLLDRHSRHHAWRAAQWWERLPVLADVDREALCTAPSGGWAAAIEAMASVAGTAERLASLYRVVVPRLHSRYHAQGREASEVADGASLRTLRIVGADLASDWHAGEAVLEDLLADAGLVGAAMAAAAGVETVLLG